MRFIAKLCCSFAYAHLSLLDPLLSGHSLPQLQADQMHRLLSLSSRNSLLERALLSLMSASSSLAMLRGTCVETASFLMLSFISLCVCLSLSLSLSPHTYTLSPCLSLFMYIYYLCFSSYIVFKRKCAAECFLTGCVCCTINHRLMGANQ